MNGFRRFGVDAARWTVRLALRFAPSRVALNGLANLLPLRARRFFWAAFGNIFTSRTVAWRDCTWTVQFAGGAVRLPLRAGTLSSDWINVVTLIGHDVEEKETYSRVLNSTSAPDLFIDIGANYGTHSLLFMSRGVRAISFEPNPACHEFFLASCRLNGFQPRLEGVALGAEPGSLTLSFPKDKTWLGTLCDVDFEEDRADVVKLTVDVRQLDSYLPELSAKRVFMKVDAEGSELGVLSGAENLLRELRPIVAFESWGSTDREKLWSFFSARNYVIRTHHSSQSLDLKRFLERPEMNFLATATEG